MQEQHRVGKVDLSAGVCSRGELGGVDEMARAGRDVGCNDKSMSMSMWPVRSTLPRLLVIAQKLIASTLGM